MSQPAKAAITRCCENMAGIGDEFRAHKEIDNSRILRDEMSVQKITETIEAMINPWTTSSTGLVSLSSGAMATATQQDHLLTAGEIGEQKASQYISERLVSAKVDMFSTLKATKLQTFATLPKKLTSKVAQQKTVQSDRSLFARLLIASKQRSVDIEMLLSYSLSSTPPSLSTSDGTGLSKCVKAQLLRCIEEKCKTVNHVQQIPQDTSLMVDCMALVQSMPKSSLPDTFGELAQKILQQLVHLAKTYNARRVDLVGDRYLEHSIKNTERSRRAHGKQTEIITIYGAHQRLPRQWTKFLGSGTNKNSLQSFLLNHFTNSVITDSLVLYLGLRDECVRLMFSPQAVPISELVPSLNCDHEEADTRLLLHGKHSDAEGAGPTIIWSPDTDVAIMCLAHNIHFRRGLLFSTGTGNLRRILDISAMSKLLGEDLTSSLIGLHCFSGCDSTSSFYGRGKPSILKMVESDIDARQQLSLLGVSWELSDELQSSLQKVVCTLYGQPKARSLAEARYHCFCNSTSSEKSLPPTEAALSQHALRSNFQACIWKRALQQNISAPDPVNHGWQKSDGELLIKWFPDDHTGAPEHILQLVSCSCKKKRCEGRCSCRAAKLPCTPLCSCTDCGNDAVSDNEADYSDDDDAE